MHTHTHTHTHAHKHPQLGCASASPPPSGGECSARIASPLGLIPASKPRALILVGVVGGVNAVRAHCARAHVVARDGQVHRAANAQVVEAKLHVDVLAPSLPLQLSRATVRSRKVGLHGRSRERLQGAEHHGPARPRALATVLHVDSLAGDRPQLLAYPACKDHAVGVSLQDEVVHPPSEVLSDLLPGLHEDQGVGCRAILGDAHGHRGDLRRWNSDPQV
mmetsp:Transcript_102364/g.272396  ORF Transcript_102364/g.272396 Transcript_102364/m.272396 type:complete len:220 (+) Transcript_102364:1-660(+)